jgi:hypothetical protein
MVTMAVRQAAAKAKPIEVLRIMTITCDEGQDGPGGAWGPSPPGKYPEPDLGEMLWGLALISAIVRPR